MSEKTKHTPGPWVLFCVTGNGGNVTHLVPVDGDRQSILTVVDTDDAVFAAVYSDSDARLIAAAPELLEVLEMYSLPLGNNEERDVFEFGEYEVKREKMRRAAIAKAKDE